MDLEGAGGYFRWSNAWWFDIIELAQEFGWVPIGTGPPRGVLKADWTGGSYQGNEGQRVYARDARALADALERALAVIRVHGPRNRTRRAMATDYVEAVLTESKGPKRGRVAVQKFGANDIAYLREFIKFCRAGSFRIY